MEAMPKTIKRTLSGSEMAPPFHRTSRISLNYCAAYFFRKDGVCVALAYFFPGRVRRLFLPGTLQVRSKHVNDTVRYGNFFLTPTVYKNLKFVQGQPRFLNRLFLLINFWSWYPFSQILSHIVVSNVLPCPGNWL